MMDHTAFAQLEAYAASSGPAARAAQDRYTRAKLGGNATVIRLAREEANRLDLAHESNLARIAATEGYL